MHRIHAEHLPERLDDLPRRRLIIDGPEAEHALRVKRLVPGEAVEVLDGRGRVARGTVGDGGTSEPRRPRRDWTLELVLDSLGPAAPARPVLHVCSATPKGGRVDDMIDQLAQAGAAAWSPLLTARGVVDPRDSKLARLERIAREASKQAGRAWDLALGDPVAFASAVDPGWACRSMDVLSSAAGQGVRVLIADAGGEPPGDLLNAPAGLMRLLIGPEGGFTDEELALANERGAKRVRFGPHTMRIETAAVVAAGVIMSQSRDV